MIIEKLHNGALHISGTVCNCKLTGRDAGIICYSNSIFCYGEKYIKMTYYGYSRTAAVNSFKKYIKEEIKKIA
jgi:hypothetical protein